MNNYLMIFLKEKLIGKVSYRYVYDITEPDGQVAFYIKSGENYNRIYFVAYPEGGLEIFYSQKNYTKEEIENETGDKLKESIMIENGQHFIPIECFSDDILQSSITTCPSIRISKQDLIVYSNNEELFELLEKLNISEKLTYVRYKNTIALAEYIGYADVNDITYRCYRVIRKVKELKK